MNPSMDFSRYLNGGFSEPSQVVCSSTTTHSLPGSSGLNYNVPLEMNELPFLNDSLSVKTELKKAITDKKIANGEEIPTVEYKEPPPPQLRPPEKPEDLKKKREKNKLAAMKCRKKKKEYREYLYKKIEKYQVKNSTIRAQVSQLRAEKDNLEQLMERHLCLQPSPQLVDSHLTDLSSLFLNDDSLHCLFNS